MTTKLRYRIIKSLNEATAICCLIFGWEKALYFCVGLHYVWMSVCVDLLLETEQENK